MQVSQTDKFPINLATVSDALVKLKMLVRTFVQYLRFIANK